MHFTFADARFNMVEGQIKPFSVIDTAVLEAFRTVPREQFVPEAFTGLAYSDEELNLGQGRYLLDPAIHARLLQELAIDPAAHVLDIGCLQGYSSHILAQLAAKVTAIDTAEWVAAAQKSSTATNITFVAGDMAAGVAAQGPYQAIVIHGGVEQVPTALLDQLVEDGVIATFKREGTGGYAVLYSKQNGQLHPHRLFDAFVPLLPGFAQQPTFVF